MPAGVVQCGRAVGVRPHQTTLPLSSGHAARIPSRLETRGHVSSVDMRMLFRCDASDVIGTGHVMRCLALAVGLRSHAVDAFFVCADQPGNMSRAISAQGFPLRLIRPCSTEWDDAQATIEAVTDAQPFDWLVVDSYL